ncbi:MAG TPA: TIGR03960 family B12-binding radical SAM protein [Firmicutes bacterium]|nr:TIGR03960 family B12-binding radical SAM protein [Bacillota bacterium]
MSVNPNIIEPEQIRLRLDDILPHVEKPSRYFAGEIGAFRKDWNKAVFRAVIAFPDVYEIAAANLGHKLIQHVLNSRDEFLAERVYAPWHDMEKLLRETQTPLYSLESYRPVSSFDILGISLTHELSYTNLLLLLDLAGLPLRASERGLPIVICGGPSVFNPEPVAEFADAFLLGDGEYAAVEIAEIVAGFREEIDRTRGDIQSEKDLKIEILSRLGETKGNKGVRGVYVPSHFAVEQTADGKIESVKNIEGGPDIIEKAFVSDLDSAPWELKPPIPHMQGVSNRSIVEPVRGCTHGCRFCQAGMIYRPFRTRSVENLVEQAESLLSSTGFSEQSILALSATDWSSLDKFIIQLQEHARDFHLRISLPSGRIAKLPENVTSILVKNRKGGLTLAIEAATQRLRSVINKDIDDDEIFNAFEIILSSGWDLVKLYFMIGLPTETDEDVEEIVTLVGRIVGYAKRLKKEGKSKAGNPRLKVSASSFVPKPHTPFQWAEMLKPEELDRRQKLLLGIRRIKSVDLSTHDTGASWIEGILARGDRRLSCAIERAFRLGARFDAWSDRCRPDIWKKAMDECGLEPDYYLGPRDTKEILPWDHLSCGVSKEFLQKEWKKSLEMKMTRDCNESVCLNCGIRDIFPDCSPQRLKEE